LQAATVNRPYVAVQSRQHCAPFVATAQHCIETTVMADGLDIQAHGTAGEFDDVLSVNQRVFAAVTLWLVRGGVAAAAVFLALLTAPLAGAGSRPPLTGGSMTVATSNHTAGARGVRLTLTLQYVMRCANPGPGPLVVSFPAGMKLPKQFASGAVKLAGKPVAADVDGRQVTVTVPPHKGMLCDMMGVGSVSLTFARSAKLANPAQAGSYRFKATHRSRAFTAKLAIKPSA